MEKENCALHEKKISELIEKGHRRDLQLAKIESNVEHIKGRIDNGMSKTINDIWNLINKDIVPAVKDSTYWVGKIKWALAIVFFVGVARIVWDKISYFIN